MSPCDEIPVDIHPIPVIEVTIEKAGPAGPQGDIGLTGAPGTIVSVSTEPPSDPEVGTLWVDIS
jgi:hypothetical protein